MKGKKLKSAIVLLLTLAMILTQAAVSFADDGDSAEAKQVWTLGLSKNTNGPEDGVQGTNGWYFMYSEEINLGEGNLFDVDGIKETTWATQGSMQLASEGGSYDAMWVPGEYISDELTGDALKQPDGSNPDATFNNWIMTSDGTLNTDVETTAVSGIYAWEAPEAGEYQYFLSYTAGGNHCDLGGVRYYYYKDYFIKDGTEYKKVPEQREGGVAVSINTKDAQLAYAEHAAMTEDHDYLYAGNFNGKVTLEAGEKIYFAVDPREVGSYDMANLSITVTTGEDCVWDEAVTYEWDDNNNCTAIRECKTHEGHMDLTTAVGEVTEVTKEGSCTVEGEGVYTAKFDKEGLEDQSIVRPIAAKGHDTPYTAWANIDWDADDYGPKTRIDWAEDYSSVTWYSQCNTCGEFVAVETATPWAEEVSGSAADCENGGLALYKASFYWGWFWVESEPVEVDALGHDTSAAYENIDWEAEDYGENTKVELSDDHSELTWYTKCGRCGEFVEVETQKATVEEVTAPTCTEDGVGTYSASFWWGWFPAKVTGPIDATHHKYVDGVCSVCGEEKPAGDVERIAGNNRYSTSLSVAKKLLEVKGTDKVDTIIIATGGGFADSLAGSYLSSVKDNAPIIAMDPKAGTNQTNAINFVKEHISNNGTVYILGGTSAVSNAVEAKLKASVKNVKRLEGNNRYATNLSILKEAGVSSSKELLVSTGNNYADSLSASASGRPMLLVKDALTDEQKDFLSKNFKGKKITVLGGTGAVSDEVYKELSAFTSGISRIAGANRFDTSKLIAIKYSNKAKSAVIAYGRNFPDGLSGGPLAMELGAPLLLSSSDANDVKNNVSALIAEYSVPRNINDGFVLGGAGLVSDNDVKTILECEAITLYK